METTVFGHRGVPEKYIENSLPGFKYLAQHGEAVEFDVQLTRDHEPIIMHDEKINRTTNGHGFIRRMTLAELRQYHLVPDKRRVHQLHVEDNRIPTLDEVLQVFQGTNIMLNIELKTDKLDYPGIEALVLEKVQAYGLMAQTIFSSFRPETIQRVHALAPNQPIALISRQLIKNPAEVMTKYHLSALHMKKTTVRPEWANYERAWTIDQPSEMMQMFQYHFAGFFTDDFEQALELEQQLN
ncbi:glycerophosphoryl diester phosphodiesterase [Weissella uvarum]|uniref:glycerophosphodiester phosphodiesterase family protein n=1 Tax=Weissella uvarum TaxID=1479233 RepID=UPI0019608F12|nr:glycerophosphoryl diester phosphodiesterase [Weissella uvarum]MCM0595184.1 glycerophosphodiester phosphodiesterase [Weissella uvarum]